MTILVIMYLKNCFGGLCEPLNYLFNLSVEKAYLMTQVSPIYKDEDSSDVNNYKPISMLPYFSIILERIMYNR